MFSNSTKEPTTVSVYSSLKQNMTQTPNQSSQVPSTPQNQTLEQLQQQPPKSTPRISQTPTRVSQRKSKLPLAIRMKQMESTPSVVKSEGMNLMKKIESALDDVESAEELYTLSLFAKNRAALVEANVLQSLALCLKTKSPGVKQVTARTLQLYAQDGGENCEILHRLNLCHATLELLQKTHDPVAQTPIVGLIYWLVQHPKCKKTFKEIGADIYLKDLNAKTKDPLLSKYLSYACHSLEPHVKSREEMLEYIRTQPLKPTLRTDEAFQTFSAPSSSSVSPIHFLNLFKTPESTQSPESGKQESKEKTPQKVQIPNEDNNEDPTKKLEFKDENK